MRINKSGSDNLDKYKNLTYKTSIAGNLKERCLVKYSIFSALFISLYFIVTGCVSTRIVEESTNEGQIRYRLKRSPLYKEEIRHGASTTWYPNGNKKSETIYSK